MARNALATNWAPSCTKWFRVTRVRSLSQGRSDVALVVGGAQDVLLELYLAAQLCLQAGVTYETFAANDMIATLEHCDHAVTLHPNKLPGWLGRRAALGLHMPREVWCHRTDQDAPAITRTLAQVHPGRTSSGYFAMQVDLHLGYDRIILCGVPMTEAGGHVVRNRPWDQVRHFTQVWVDHRVELAAHVKSMSGWTRELLGYPTVAFLQGIACPVVA
jgi:hypothetical protein